METNTTAPKPKSSKLGRNPLETASTVLKVSKKFSQKNSMRSAETLAAQEPSSPTPRLVDEEVQLHQNSAPSETKMKFRINPVLRAVLFVVASGIALREWLEELRHS